MRRDMGALLVSLPLAAGGVEAAHALAFRAIYPDPALRQQILAESGHGYMLHWTTAATVLGVLALGGFMLRIRSARAGSPHRLSAALLLTVAPCAFVVQECLERVLSNDTPLGVAVEPTFLPALLLQVPFALLTFFAARLILRAADRLGRHLLPAIRHRPVLSLDIACVRFDGPAPRDVLAFGQGRRGPPAFARA